MKKQTIEFSEILAAHRNLQSLAEKVAMFEAELVIEERHLENSRKDDGVSDPEAIYARTESISRKLAILRIEANRAAAKLAETEELFGSLIMKAAPSILAHVEQVAQKAEAEISAKAAALFGEAACMKPELKQLVRNAPAVAEPTGVAHRLHLCINTYASKKMPPQDFIGNVLSAEKFL